MSATSDKGTSRSCIFCGGRPVTREHVIPEWIAKCFPHEGPHLHTSTEDKGAGRATKPYPAGVFRTKARVVCHKCNSGWMSDLENAVKPLLKWMMVEGRGCALGAEDQATLATWSLKTATVLQCSRGRDGQKAIPPEHRHELREEGRPPSAYRIALAARPHEGAWPYRFIGLGLDFDLASGRPLPAPPGLQFNSWRSAVCIGHFIAHIFGKFFEAGGVFDFPQPTRRAFVDVWPPTSQVTWPPELLLSSGVLNEMFTPRTAPPQ